MSDGAKTFQADLGRGTFYRVNGAEQFVDLFGIVVALEGNQAIADNLEMLFGFRLEKFQNFVGNFIVRGQGIEIGARGSRDGDLCFLVGRVLRIRIRLRIVERRRLDRESKTITLLEGSDVFDVFLASVANFEKIGFQQRNAIGKKFCQRTVQILAQGSVQCVLKNVREFCRNFREARKTVASRSSTESV